MGCGCKQQPIQQQPITLQVKDDYIEIIDPIPVSFTRHEITRALDYFNAKIKRDEEKRFVIDLHNREFSNETFDYNIQGQDMFTVEDRIKYMNKLLSSYENSINRNK